MSKNIVRNTILATLFTGISALSLISYSKGEGAGTTINPSIPVEVYFLRGASDYIQPDIRDPKDPKEALDYVKMILRQNRGFQPEKIRALEEEVAKIDEQIDNSTPPEIYKREFKKISNKIESVAYKEARNPIKLMGGLISGIIALPFWVLAFKEASKEN